jgi:hypothetical protein
MAVTRDDAMMGGLFAAQGAELVSFDFLVGAIIGSGVFIFFGGPPARVLAKAVQRRLRR